MTVELGHEGLTPEEIEALKIDDGDPTVTQGELEDKAAASGTTTEEDPNADPDNKEPGGDGTGIDPAADPAAAAAAEQQSGEPATAGSEQGAAPSPTQQAPILVAQAPEDADAKLAAIADQKKELRQKYDDGDLTFDEYESQKDALDEQRMELKLQIDKANIAAEMEQQRRKNEWDSQCNDFLKSHPEYDGGKGERFEHLNAMLKAIAVMPQNAGLTGPQMLEKAHRLALADRGEAAPAPKTDAGGKKTKQSIPKAELPPDIGALPAAGGNDPSEGKWASLDKLQTSNPLAYEKALKDMSEADRDAYLAAS
jgi:hypothetical protein